MGRKPGRRATRFHRDREATVAREALEERWRGRISRDESLADLVTGRLGASEPYHRWVRFKQAFSPELVRRFLGRHPGLRGRSKKFPVLDPLSGSGTTVIECARLGVRSVGVEASPAMAFLATARNEIDPPSSPEMLEHDPWESIAEKLTHPLHRAALMIAESRRHDSAGKPLRQPRTIGDEFARVIRMMQADLREPLPVQNSVGVGDARDLSRFDNASMGALLTSPPYLSRHDYDAILEPIQCVHRFWFGGKDGGEGGQITAHAASDQRSRNRAAAMGYESGDDSVLKEITDGLHRRSAAAEAGVVSAYFSEMNDVIRECSRVLAGVSPCWIVVAGARIKDVYVPADLMLAEFAEGVGFRVEAIVVAREVTRTRRKLGTKDAVAPRESILQLIRR